MSAEPSIKIPTPNVKLNSNVNSTIHSSMATSPVCEKVPAKETILYKRLRLSKYFRINPREYYEELSHEDAIEICRNTMTPDISLLEMCDLIKVKSIEW